MSSSRAGKSVRRKSPPKLAMSAPAFRARITSPPRPVSLRSPIRAKDRAALAGYGRATSACEPPSPASPTIPVMSNPWAVRVCRKVRERGCRHPYPSASLPAYRSASSGEFGRRDHHHTTRISTPQPGCSLSRVDTGSLMDSFFSVFGAYRQSRRGSIMGRSAVLR